MSSLRVLLLASILALTACDLRPEDYSGLQASAERFHTKWTARLAEVQAVHQALLTRVQALPADTAGAADATAQLNAIGATLTDLSKSKLATVEQEVQTRIDARQHRLAEEALRHGAEDVSAAITDAASGLEIQRGVVEAAEQAAAATKQEADAKDQLRLTSDVVDIVDPAFGRAKGTSDVLGVNFKPGTSEFDMSGDVTKAALMRIIALANGCDGIRLELTAHTAKDGDAQVNRRLSIAQGEAVRQYLVASGVAEAKIAKVNGVGGASPAVPEPDAGSAEEHAMATDELAKIRARNRRITVTVVEPCPAANPA